MRISARGEYGVRLMVDLARHFGQGPLSLTEVAETEGLPQPYLEQIINDLRKAGLVTARRGRHGGYTLTKPPADITMGTVLHVLEGGISPMVCVPADGIEPGETVCLHQDYCTTRVLWLKVRDSIVDVLTATTLADMVPRVQTSAGRGMPLVDLPMAAGLDSCAVLVTAEGKPAPTDSGD